MISCRSAETVLVRILWQYGIPKKGYSISTRHIRAFCRAITVPANPSTNPGSNPGTNLGGPIATPDTGDLAGLLNRNPRFFEVNRVILDLQDSPIGPRSRILLR